MKKNLLILILTLFTVALAAQQSVDVITLKNGNVIKGRIIEQNTQMVKVYTTNRSMVELKPDEIEKMDKEVSATPEIEFSTDEDVTTQGNMIIGGSAWLGFNNPYKTNFYRVTESGFGLSLTPSVAYFVIDYLAVGADIDLGFSIKDGDFSYTLGIGPMVKYYLLGGLFVSAKATIGMDHYLDNKFSVFSLKPGVGYAIFLSPKVALEPALIYQYNSAKQNSTKYKTSSLGVEVGLTIFL